MNTIVIHTKCFSDDALECIEKKESEKYQTLLKYNPIPVLLHSTIHGNLDTFKLVETVQIVNPISELLYALSSSNNHINIFLHMVNSGYEFNPQNICRLYSNFKDSSERDMALLSMMEKTTKEDMAEIELINAIDKLSVEGVKIFRKFGFDFDEEYAIHMALECNNFDVVEELIYSGDTAQYLEDSHRDILLTHLYKTKAYDAIYLVRDLLDEYYRKEITYIYNRRQKRCEVIQSFADVEFIFND